MMFSCSVVSELSNYDSCMSVGAILRINTVVILLGDVIRGWFKLKWRGVRFERSLWEPELLEVHNVFTELLSVEGKYTVKLSITELFKISRK